MSKKVFKSAQLESSPEREQNGISPFHTTFIQHGGESHDTISENSCCIEMCKEPKVAIYHEGIFENDTRSICSEISRKSFGNSCSEMLTSGDAIEVELDIMPGQVKAENKQHTMNELFYVI